MFTPTKTRIEDILNAPTQFQVPLYQRPFKWGKDEARDFIEDLHDSARAQGDFLFLGTVIFSDTKEQKTTIVDGQQRLTTILLLLVACRARAIELGLMELAQNILTKVAFVDSTTAESRGPRLIASPSIRELFDHITHATWGGSFPQKVGKTHIRRQVKRLKPIYDFFARSLADLQKKQLSAFLKAVYDATVIRIDIESDVDALSIFERTNARGMELEISDLLKNHLFSKRVDGIEDSWERIGTNSGGTLLRMLKYFYVSRRGYIQKRQLYRKLKDYAGEITAEGLTKSLVEFSEFYDVSKSPSADRVREFFEERELRELYGHEEHCKAIARSLQALNEFGVTQYCPVAFAAIECAQRGGTQSHIVRAKAIAQLFELFEKYHFINNAICDRVGNEVERSYAEACVGFTKAEDLVAMVQKLRGELGEQLAKEEEFVERFCELTYASGEIPLLAYVFDRINNHGIHGSQRVDLYNPDARLIRRNHNIEHFLPQKPKRGEEGDDGVLEVVDNIGNLLVVSCRTNSKLGNASPEEKIAKLKGPMEKEIQNIAYVRDFITTYGGYAKAWNRERIEKRAKEMATKAYREVWKLS